MVYIFLKMFSLVGEGVERRCDGVGEGYKVSLYCLGVRVIVGNFASEKPVQCRYMMLLYLDLDDYLAQWFVNDHGGEVPVRLRRGSVESKILEVYLTALPEGEVPDMGGDGRVAVVIPSFRSRPPGVYNHLPRRARAALLNVIRERFDIALWSDLHVFGKIDRRRDELIYAWLEKHGIEATERNWCAVAKRYQRQRDMYMMRERAKVQYERRKSV